MFILKAIQNFISPNIESEFENVNEILDQNEESEPKNLPFCKNFEYVEVAEDPKKNDVTDCFQKSGIITQINGDRAVINNVLHFSIPEATADLNDDLEIGSKVEYLAYDVSTCGGEQEIRVRKIVAIRDHVFEIPTEQDLMEESAVLEQVKPQYFAKHKRSYYGLISKRAQRSLTIKSDTDIEVDFESVSMDFTPQLGDQVMVTCFVQTDESYVNSAGEILEVLKVSPQRTDTRQVRIFDVADNYGIFEGEDCYFLSETLANSGYKPAVNDLVEIECIESNGSYYNRVIRKCSWRCTKIKLLSKAPEEIIDREHDNRVLAKWISNKNGIQISDNLLVKFDDLGEKREISMEIVNNGDEDCKILYWHFRGKKSESQLTLITPGDRSPEISLNIGAKCTFKMLAEAKAPGFREEYFEWKFCTKNDGRRFQIGRKITVDVGKPIDENYETRILKYSDNLKNSNRLQSGLIIETMKKRLIIPGVNTTISPRFIEQRIGLFSIPDRLQDAVYKAIDTKTMRENVEHVCHSIAQELAPENYVPKFETLLYLEEIEHCFQIRNYDRERAHFTKQNEFLRLNIDNLAEKRPSLIIGDSLHAIPLGKRDLKLKTEGHQAFIHRVLSDHILVKFNPNFHHKYNGEDYSLYFDFSRGSFRKKHHGILEIKRKFKDDFLFPTRVTIQPNPQIDCDLDENNDLILNTTDRKFDWFNKNLNEVQKFAIKNVLRGEARPMPYIFFGPPGTGKTMTIIETILQLFTNVSSSRILVAAPSNSAANLIATRLISSGAIQPGDFLRIVGHNLVENDLVPEHLKPYCATVDISAEGSKNNETIVTESGLTLRCSKTQLCASRILIGTCMSLASLLHIKFPPGHFTHAVIDEAGQCPEPEVMTVICQLDSQRGQTILAGDPLQLGPIILNKYAAERGLELSYLSRLLATQPYSKDKQRYPKSSGYNERLVTKLIYNYRSVPSILHSFNDLFYDNELRPTIDANTSREAKLLKSLDIQQPETRNPNFGVIFYGVCGENLQDSDSPSWYNAAEAYKLVLFTMKLLQYENINPNNIGIITPYQQQVKKIRLLLETMGNLKREYTPKVGSVEEFQGQERDIILISTVRSSKRLVGTDLKYTLGFVQSEKRMNVAISRAKSLLVIFGNPKLLQMDTNWNKLIQYCNNNNSSTDCHAVQIEDDDNESLF